MRLGSRVVVLVAALLRIVFTITVVGHPMLMQEGPLAERGPRKIQKVVRWCA